MNEATENIQTKKMFFGMNELKQQLKNMRNKDPLSIFGDKKILGLYNLLNKNIFDLTKEVKKLNLFNKPTIVKRENTNELMLKELKDISKVEKQNSKLLKTLSYLGQGFDIAKSILKVIAAGALIGWLLTSNNKFIKTVREGVFSFAKKIGDWLGEWWNNGGGKENFNKAKDAITKWITDDFWPAVWNAGVEGLKGFGKALMEGSKIAWAGAGMLVFITGLWKPMLSGIMKLLGGGLKDVGILLYNSIRSLITLGRAGAGAKTITDAAGNLRYAKGTVIDGVKVGGRFVAKEGAGAGAKTITDAAGNLRYAKRTVIDGVKVGG